MKVSPEAYEKFMDSLDNPPPPNEKLRKLMKTCAARFQRQGTMAGAGMPAGRSILLRRMSDSANRRHASRGILGFQGVGEMMVEFTTETTRKRVMINIHHIASVRERFNEPNNTIIVMSTEKTYVVIGTYDDVCRKILSCIPENVA